VAPASGFASSGQGRRAGFLTLTQSAHRPDR